MSEDTFSTMAQAADAVGALLPEGALKDGFRLARLAFTAGAALSRAGSDDPVGQIERILWDDSLIAKAVEDRDVALLQKFGFPNDDEET